MPDQLRYDPERFSSKAACAAHPMAGEGGSRRGGTGCMRRQRPWRARLIDRLFGLRRAPRRAVVFTVLISALGPTLAQGGTTLASTVANANTIGVISGEADGTYIRIGADLANVLDGDDVRLLPIIGRGSLQNLRDVMVLRGVDIGSVRRDAREQLKAESLRTYP